MRKVRFLLLPLLSLGLMVPLLAQGQVQTAQTASICELPAGATMESLWRYVADLADPQMLGRLTGAPSGRKAEEYVAAAMRALKLQVMAQPVTFPLYEVGKPVALELLDGAQKPIRSFQYVDDFREIDYSGSGDVRGELFFVGWGIDEAGLSPYAGLDLKGKIAVILSGAPQGTDPELVRPDRKLDWAYRHGARAAVIVPSGKMAERMAATRKEAKMRALDWKYGFHADLYHADMPAVFVHADATELLTGKKVAELAADPAPRALGKSVRLLLNGHVYPQATSHNVIGILQGSDPLLASETILIGAHYDHLGVGGDGRVFCGAADNASGSAVVLEAARAFSACAQRPKRTLVFALWCGEEQGLHGSNHYVNQEPLLPLEKTKLMIQLDSLDNQQGPCITNITDNETIQRFFAKAIAEKRVEVLDTKGQCASDDCAFLAKKVPACRFVAFGEHHHQDVDTIAHLNKEILKKTADLVIEGIRNTAY